MEPESDDEEQISPNTFIVLDSQRPPRLDEGENQAAGEREADCHAATLKNLEISRASCPETPAHLQGSEVKQKRQEHELKLDLPATDLNVSHEILTTTKSPTSFSSLSSGTASGQLCSLSLYLSNSSTSDGDAKSPMFGMSTQNVALSGAEPKSGSFSSSSSTYPQSSSSSHRSQDTISIPSSPEFRKPIGTALHRTNTSSSSSGSPSSDAKTRPSRMRSSGEEEMLAAPPKKPKLEDQDSLTEFSDPEKQSQEHSDPDKKSQEQHSSSESISFQKTDHHHSTPTELSSREVTHIDTPQMKSTPADGSFECLQLSGDVAKSVASVYSLPDPLPSSPSPLRSISSGSNRLVTESDVSLSSGFSGSEETRNQSKMQQIVRGKPGVGSALPKWVRESVREKKVEKKIHFSSSSDSAHKSGSSSPGSTSDDRSPPHRPLAIKSKCVESQEEMSCEDFEESCVYPVQDVAASSKSSAECEEMDGDDKQDITVPQTKGSRDVKNAGEATSLKKATKHLFSDMEIEMSQDLFNPLLTASETIRSSQPCSKDRLVMLEEKAEVPKLGSFEEHDKPASASDVDLELNLFLSQTQPGPSQAQHRPSQMQPGPSQSNLDTSQSQNAPSQNQRFPSQTQLHASETQLRASQIQQGPKQTVKSNETSNDIRSSLLEDRDSNGSVKTLPSQSIINNNSNSVTAISQTSIHAVKEVEMTVRSATEKETEEQQRLNIPKDVIERVVAADTATESSLNKFHFTLPPEGEPIHPQRTITPPIGRTTEDIEQTEDSSDLVQNLAVEDKKDETASQASTQDSVKAIATEKPSKSMLEPESPTSEEDEESIDIPKIVGFPPTKIDEDRVKNIDDNQVESETIFAKALKVGGGLTKRDVHSTSPDTDPFAFSERDKQDLQPKKKRRRLAELPQPQPSTSKEIPKPNLPVSTQEEKLVGEISERIEENSSDGEAYCLSVTEIIEKVETRTHRMMVTEYRSLKTGKVLKTIEEAEPENKTVIKKCLTSTEVIVPTEGLDLNTKENDKKGKKSPRKTTPKQPCRTSPRVQKRKRSSSSTPPGDVSAVPKERPNQKGKAKDTPVRSSEGRKSKDKPKHSKDETKKSKKTKKAKHKKNSKRSKDEKTLKSKEKQGDPDVKPGKPDEEKTEYEKLLELEWESMRRKTRNTQTAIEGSAAQNASGQLKTYSRGFGRWNDGRYYPGKITSKADNGRYKMIFDDGKSLLLILSSFVSLDVLPIGQRLFALERNEGCFNISTVVAVHKNKDGKAPDYDVQFDCNKQVKRVKTADLMLDSKQIEEFIETGPEYVSGDDQPVVASKGQSSLKLDIIKNKTPKEKKYEMRMKRAEEIVVGSRDLSSPTSEEQEPVEKPWKRKRNIFRKSPEGFDMDTNDAAAILDEKKTCSDTKKGSNMEKIEQLKLKQDDPEFIKLYGPLPSNKNLFRGYAFLITRSTPKEMNDEIRIRCEGFRRPYIACQIVAGGGTVVDSMKELLDIPPETIILIAPMAQITVKYYFALSNGVPCLSHTWLQRCCKENKLIDKEDYLLEAGCDYISGEMIMAPKDTRVFAGRKIFLQITSSPKCDKEELALAVKFAGGEIISKLPKIKRDDAPDDDDDEHCDFILVGDNVNLNRSVVARANALGIPCVTQRYFNQCVTHGEILDPSIDPFKYENLKKS